MMFRCEWINEVQEKVVELLIYIFGEAAKDFRQQSRTLFAETFQICIKNWKISVLEMVKKMLFLHVFFVSLSCFTFVLIFWCFHVVENCKDDVQSHFVNGKLLLAVCFRLLIRQKPLMGDHNLLHQPPWVFWHKNSICCAP